MWIPYGLLGPLKAETSPESVRASEHDAEEREFLVGFYVRNPVTQVWEADLLVDQESCKEDLILGGRPACVGFFPGSSGKLEEIIYRVKATAAQTALEVCFEHVCDLLGLWAVQIGRGLDIAGYRLADVKHHARWRCVPFRPSALDLPSADAGALTRAHLELANLYREARNATSPRWRLLCAVAILEAWQRRDGAFAATERLLADRGEERRKWHVSQDMLLRSGALSSHDHLLGKSFEELMALLAAYRDRVLVTLSMPAGDRRRDGHAAEAQLAALANLADLAARQVLAEEFDLHRRLSSEPAARHSLALAEQRSLP